MLCSTSVALLMPALICISAAQGPGVPEYTAPGLFPTSLFPSYIQPPVPTQEPQPYIHDPVLNVTFPFNLTDPLHIPSNKDDPLYFPKALVSVSNDTANAIIQAAIVQVQQIIASDALPTNCSKCLAALSVGKVVAQLVPEHVPDALVALCTATKFASAASCFTSYTAETLGQIYTQVLALADVSGQDGEYICSSLSSSFCAQPTVNKLNTTGLFPKPKPTHAKAVPQSDGKRLKVLHLSDIHLDPRYYVSSEANCTSGQCCRPNVKNSGVAAGQISVGAPLFGAFNCDPPYDLVAAALQSIGPLAGVTKEHPFAWTVYTGDIVTHDAATALSRAFTEEVEVGVFDMMKAYIKAPVYAALGNHDTTPVAIDSPHVLPGPLGQQFSWNYDHIASLWQLDGWIDPKTAASAKLHYGAYMVQAAPGLRVITLNADFWYRSNILNFINSTNPDVSGSLAFLISQLQDAEDCGQRVWIIGHVLTGWDGTNPLPNPTDLFYQIVDRYSPHVIANIFFGHTHEDQISIFYANNGTVRSSDTAQTQAWIGPSLTPLTNLNSGFRVYEVDSHSYEIMEAYTFFANVSEFANLGSATHGPVFEFEYSTRQAYPVEGGWPATAPLNATFWHKVTEAMENNGSLVEKFNTYQGKSSVRTPNCTSTHCQEAKICYMRSGSQPLGKACRQGFGSVQSPFTGK